MATYNSNKFGLPPGTMIYVGENSPKPTYILMHIYDNESYQQHVGFDYQILQDAMAVGKHAWIDIHGLADIEQITTLCNDLKIHPLIAEDLVNTRQRPKLEFFEEYIFLVFKLISPPSPERITYNQEQFSLLTKKNLLITFRETNDYDLTPLYKRLSAELSMIRQHGSDYLTYLIFDNIVDHYFDFVDVALEQLTAMEDLIIENRDTLQLKEIYIIKRHSVILRKTIAPLSDIIDTLLTDPSRLIDKTYRLYYRDLRDHTIRLLETIDINLDMISSMLDIYLSTVNNSMNRSMKTLTIFASLFIPLSFISSIYGMNFTYMPELKLHYGYPAVLCFMGVVAIMMVYYFRRKKIL